MTPENLHKLAVLRACFNLQAEIEALLQAHPEPGARYGKSANVDLNLLGWYNPKAGAEIVALERQLKQWNPSHKERQIQLRIQDTFETALAEARIELQYLLDGALINARFAEPGCWNRQHATVTL